MEDKKVSIIITCYNYGEFIAEAIESALNQTYKNIEIVIVNDGSTDNSEVVINDYAQKNENIVFFNQKENKGVIYSRNMGINEAKGDYILPLDADDIIEPEYIEKAVNILNEHPEIGIVYCEADFLRENKHEDEENEKWDLPPFDEEKFKYTNMIFVTSLFRKSDFIKAGGFKEYMKNGYEDWDFWITLIKSGVKPYKIPEILFHYRQHETSRNEVVINDEIESLRTIFKEHSDYYINDNEFIKKVFRDYSKEKCEAYFNLYKNFEKSYMKYKKLFNIVLFCLIGESLLLAVYILYRIFA